MEWRLPHDRSFPLYLQTSRCHSKSPLPDSVPASGISRPCPRYTIWVRTRLAECGGPHTAQRQHHGVKVKSTPLRKSRGEWGVETGQIQLPARGPGQTRVLPLGIETGLREWPSDGRNRALSFLITSFPENLIGPPETTGLKYVSCTLASVDTPRWPMTVGNVPKPGL